MIFDFLALAIIIICGIIIFVILSRKFSVLSSINIKALPEHKQEAVRDHLLGNRLKRKLLQVKDKAVLQAQPIKVKFQDWMQHLYNKILDLEKHYRQKIEEKEPLDEIEKKDKIKDLLEQAYELSEKENFEETERKFIEAISLDYKNIEAYKGLGDIYFRQKDYEHAKEVFNHVLKLHAEDEEVYTSLGMIAFQEGNLEEARKDYAQTLALNNKVAAHHIDLGEVYVALGDEKKALECYKEAVKLEPNNPKNLDLLLEMCIKLKDKKLAEETYNNLKQVNPENEKLSEFKERIDKLK